MHVVPALDEWPWGRRNMNGSACALAGPRPLAMSANGSARIAVDHRRETVTKRALLVVGCLVLRTVRDCWVPGCQVLATAGSRRVGVLCVQ